MNLGGGTSYMMTRPGRSVQPRVGLSGVCGVTETLRSRAVNKITYRIIQEINRYALILPMDLIWPSEYD